MNLRLRCHGLTYHRGHERIFGPLSFEVSQGQALMVLGGNGAGKTTLLRVISGALRASEGLIEIDGQPCQAPITGVAYLSHKPGHKADLSAARNLAYAAALAGVTLDPQRLQHGLDEVGLDGYADVPARRMSAGQNKRLALARLRLNPAKLWLLDEPYANLDLDGIAIVNRLIAEHIQDGGAALLTTHGAYAAPPVPHRTLSLGGAA